jgi:hypothetical protein
MVVMMNAFDRIFVVTSRLATSCTASHDPSRISGVLMP